MRTIMKAWVQVQGTQILATEGATFRLNCIPGAAVGDTIELSDVLLVGEGAVAKVGTPYVHGAKVTARIIDNRRGEKVLVMKRLRRKGAHKKRGHRQELSVIKIESIEG